MKTIIFALVSIIAFVVFAVTHASGNGIIIVEGVEDAVGFCNPDGIQIVANPGASQEHIDTVYNLALIECQQYQ